MKIHYDKEVDALYIQLGTDIPEGVIEITDEINVDVTPDGKIVGIEILDSTKKIDLKTIFTYELETDEILKKSA